MAETGRITKRQEELVTTVTTTEGALAVAGKEEGGLLRGLHRENVHSIDIRGSRERLALGKNLNSPVV